MAPTQPADRSRVSAGRTFALIGVVAAAIGIVLIVLFDGAWQTLGIVIAFFALLPTGVGATLLVTRLVTHHAEEDRPFA